jgi:hypothetical protein
MAEWVILESNSSDIGLIRLDASFKFYALLTGFAWQNSLLQIRLLLIIKLQKQLIRQPHLHYTNQMTSSLRPT